MRYKIERWDSGRWEFSGEVEEKQLPAAFVGVAPKTPRRLVHWYRVEPVRVPAADVPLRAHCLHLAENLVFGEREAEYGPPAVCMGRTAAVWTALLEDKLREGVKLDAGDVAVLNAGQKLARGRQADTWVDLAGYAALGYEVTR